MGIKIIDIFKGRDKKLMLDLYLQTRRLEAQNTRLGLL